MLDVLTLFHSRTGSRRVVLLDAPRQAALARTIIGKTISTAQAPCASTISRVETGSAPNAPDDDSGSTPFDWDQLLRH